MGNQDSAGSSLREGINEMHFPHYMPQWHIAGSGIFIFEHQQSIVDKLFFVSKNVFGYLLWQVVPT